MPRIIASVRSGIEQRRERNFLSRLSPLDREAYRRQQMHAEAEEIREYRAEEEIARREHAKENAEEMQKIVKLIAKERAFFQDNRIEVEEMEKSIDKIIQSEKLWAGSNPRQNLTRLTTNIVYMLKEYEKTHRLNKQQLKQLGEQVALEVAMQIASDPSVRRDIKKSPGMLNVLVRETFQEVVNSQN